MERNEGDARHADVVGGLRNLWQEEHAYHWIDNNTDNTVHISRMTGTKAEQWAKKTHKTRNTPVQINNWRDRVLKVIILVVQLIYLSKIISTPRGFPCQ
jgi:hypothetical protein